MSGYTYFFATKNDLYVNIKALEGLRSIKYVRATYYDSQNYTMCNSVDDLTNLGINCTGEQQDESYLVLDSTTNVIGRCISLESGGVRFSVDQSVNPLSIEFWPGGFYKEDTLVHGLVATVSESEKAKDLLKFFTKNFLKVGKRADRAT